MLEIFLYAALLLALAFFWLPIAVGLRLHHPLPPETADLWIECAFFRGLAGISLHQETDSWRLHPLLCGWRLPFPALSLAVLSGSRTPAADREPGAKAPPVQTPRDLARKLFRFGSLFDRHLVEALQRLLGALHLVQPGDLSFFRYLLRSLDLRTLEVDARLGFPDPARTGSAFGLCQALDFLNSARFCVRLVPNFERPGFYGRGRLIFHLYLGRLFFTLLRASLQLTFRWLSVRFSWWNWKPRLL